MRRIAFTLVGLVGLVLCGSQVAMAHGHGGYHHPVGRQAYYNGFGGYGAGYRGYGVGYGGVGYGGVGYGGVGYGGVGYGGVGCAPVVGGYAAPYAYGYQQSGFGVSLPNFSLFVR
jgi:hypothetical protein